MSSHSEHQSHHELIKLSANYNNSLDLEMGLFHLKKFCDLNTVGRNSSIVPFFLNYTTRQYVFMHRNAEQLTGHNAKYFFDGGLEFIWSVYHKDDFELFDKTIFAEGTAFMKTCPVEMHQDLIFSRNYRVKSKNGPYVDLLQRYCIINHPGTFIPLGVVGVGTDITNFKQDGTTIFTIEYSDPGVFYDAPKLLFKKVYFKDPCLAMLSKRELEILKYISNGFASKQIADKLFLSINTVNQHRKNMLHKSSSLNSAELINTAIKQGLL